MANKIDESVLQGIFNSGQSSQLTTQAKFWIINDGGVVPTYPTVYVPGNTTLVINGQEHTFTDGAYVYNRYGTLGAIDARSADGGGITVDGSGPRASSTDPYSYRKTGNIATLKYTTPPKEGVGSISLNMPENQGYGFTIPYPASTAEDLVNAAERQGAIVHIKNPYSKEIEGFFTKGEGGILPKHYSSLMSGLDLKPGQFVSITRAADGSPQLFAYQNYTPAEMNRWTRGGTMAPPGNDMTKLTNLDGSPINLKKFPALNVSESSINASVAAGAGPEKAPGTKADGSEARAEGPATKPIAAQPQPDAPGARTLTPDGKLVLPDAKPGVPGAPPDASSVGDLTGLARLARYVAPIALGITPLIESVHDGYMGYEKNGSALEGAEGAALGAGKGILDTFLPGARDGYSDVVGSGDRTVVDRILNAANDMTGTATAVGSAAVIAETAGVVTIPATIPTGVATVFAGLANLGVNATKGVLKVTGLAGKDQDGGYIYDGAKLAIGAIEAVPSLFEHSSNADHLLKTSAEASLNAHTDATVTTRTDGLPQHTHA